MNTLGTFAWQLGAHARTTRAYSLTWHKAYVKATPETQVAWRLEWITHFLSGNLEISVKQAEKIIEKSRPDRTKAQQNAYRAAEMKFNYHIVRSDSTDSRAEPTKPTKPTKVRVSAAERAAWEKFVKVCGSAERAAAVAAVM